MVNQSRTAAILVHFEDPEQTNRTLDGLLKSKQIDRILLVNHGAYPEPNAGTSKIEYLVEPNRGYAAGLNLAFKHLHDESQQKQALVINPDVDIEPQTIDEIVNEHQRAGAACTFPSVREGRIQIDGYRIGRFGTLRRVSQKADYFPGTCFILSVDAWKTIGGLDESYFHYFEDADLCLRLKDSGFQVHHAPEIIVMHRGKSRRDYPGTNLPFFAVRNHLLFLNSLDRMNALTFINVTSRHLLYLFRWKRGWRGIKPWAKGIREYLNR
ncbi:MAG TPA: glycosyltransferase family 2 protein [Acidobacteriota bacterium]|nr:glycosyltransferase family 2 protein [Acidobacteriota bacterium]